MNNDGIRCMVSIHNLVALYLQLRFRYSYIYNIVRVHMGSHAWHLQRPAALRKVPGRHPSTHAPVSAEVMVIWMPTNC